MRYRHIQTGILAEFVRQTAHGWMCVDVADRGHFMIYPAEQWEAA